MKALIIAATAAASLIATAASAQQAGAPANPGPVIPGVCVYYNARLLAQSSAGQAVEARMQQLAQEVQGELQPYATSIQSDAQQLQASGSSLPADQLQQRRQALQQRAKKPSSWKPPVKTSCATPWACNVRPSPRPSRRS